MGDFPNPDTQFKPGQSGNPRGPKKGTIHLHTRIRRLIGEDIDWSKVPIRGADKLGEKYGKVGWDALIYVAYAKALEGDAAARKWISESAFGTKLDLTTADKPLPTPIYNGEAAKTIGKPDPVNGVNTDEDDD